MLAKEMHWGFWQSSGRLWNSVWINPHNCLLHITNCFTNKLLRVLRHWNMKYEWQNNITQLSILDTDTLKKYSIPFSHNTLLLPLGFFWLSHCFHHESVVVLQHAGFHNPVEVDCQSLSLLLDDAWLYPPSPEHVNCHSLSRSKFTCRLQINQCKVTDKQTHYGLYPRITWVAITDLDLMKSNI